jgi:acyl phosphate:glycerol-3-phosphate acyltransferase
METILLSVLVTVVGYLIGSIPNGYLVIKLFKRQDITKIGSGRTGGTNAMRAGGVWMGFLTAVLDILKGYISVLIARLLLPASVWPQVMAGIAAVFGHNWSIWLHLLTGRLNAGAGTGPNLGAAMFFWHPVALIVIPVVLFCVFVIGYASVASMAAAVAIVIIVAWRTSSAGLPWQFIIYGIATLAMVVWALRPNIRRLVEGTERRVGIFAPRSAHN